jgi:hypothetical protein
MSVRHDVLPLAILCEGTQDSRSPISIVLNGELNSHESLRRLNRCPILISYRKINEFRRRTNGINPSAALRLHCGSLVRHRMPLYCQLSPLLFGALVGRVFGLSLTPDRFEVVFGRQVNLGDALKRRHSSTPNKHSQSPEHTRLRDDSLSLPIRAAVQFCSITHFS